MLVTPGSPRFRPIGEMVGIMFNLKVLTSIRVACLTVRRLNTAVITAAGKCLKEGNM